VSYRSENPPIEYDLYVRIEEFGALAEVVVPPIDLNDIRRERSEFLAQTASDLYDRVVYMVRANELEPTPTDGNDVSEDPEVSIELEMRGLIVSSSFWYATRRERQNALKHKINELFWMLMNLKKNVEEEENKV